MKVKEVLIKKLFGTIPVFLLITLIGIGGASAAYLNFYGTMEITANVDQSLLVDNSDSTSTSNSYDTTGGGTVTELHTLKTNSVSPVPIGFTTTYDPNGQGITTTYQLVTTAMSKDGDGIAETTWYDNDSVYLSADGTDATANVMVPVRKDYTGSKSPTITSETDGDAYWQLMINLDPSDPDSNWVQKTDGGCLFYSSEGEFLEDKVCSDIPGTAVIVGVKANLWETGSDIVDSIEFDGTTYELNQDDRAEVDVTADGLTMPPLPEEQFDFQITNDFAVDLEPSTYTINTTVVPK